MTNVKEKYNCISLLEREQDDFLIAKQISFCCTYALRRRK